MTGFWIIVALMMLASLAFIIVPLSRPRTLESASEAQSSLAIHRQRMRELEAAGTQASADPAALSEARDDIARQVLVDAADDAARCAPPEVSAVDRNALLGAALALPALAVSGYFWLGDVGALNELAATRSVEASMSAVPQELGAEHSVARMVARLETKLQASSQDAEGWALLGRSYGYLKQHDKAVAALTRADALNGDNPRTMADLAEALMLANGHRVDTRVQALLDRVIALEPEHSKARLLLELMHRDTKPVATSMPAAAASGSLTVRVSLVPALRTALKPEATVFIFARPAQGVRMPLAIVRRSARELPVEVALSDAQAMSPDHRLSQFERVVIGARVSVSGSAMASAGDLEGLGAPIVWARAGAVNVEIDRVVR